MSNDFKSSNTQTMSGSELSWFERQWRNKPQTNSVGSAGLLFIAGGMNIAWAIGYTKYTAFVVTTFVAISWFVGAIIGTAVGAVLSDTIKSRKYLYWAASLLVLIDGIVLIAASRDKTAVTAAHIIDGLAVGLVFVPAIVLAGEESISYMRGKCAASIEVMCFFLGVFLEIIFTQSWSYTASLEFNVIQVQGCFNITMAICAAIVTWLFYVESPIYHLTLGDEQAAITCLQRLQNPPTLTTDTYEMLHADKEYVAANELMSRVEAAQQGWPALLLLTFFRTNVAMSFCYATYVALYISSSMANDGFPWSELVIVAGAMLFVGSLLGTLLMDRVGRKIPTMVGLVVCAVLAFVVAAIFGNILNVVLSSGKMLTAMILIITYQFFVGVYSASSSTYLTEAFAMEIKPYYIAGTFIVQLLVQLIVVCCAGGGGIDVSAFYYVLGVFHALLALLAIVFMPETKKTTLLGAQNMFDALFWR